MSMTASTKDEFTTWLIATIKESKAMILAHNTDIVFDVDGHVTQMEAKELAFRNEFGKIAPMEAAKVAQVKLVNEKRDDGYSTSSATADALSGYLGKDHTLSVIIHKKRDTLSNPANRGAHKLKDGDEPTEPTTPTPEV